jgi:hypothetical protein
MAASVKTLHSCQRKQITAPCTADAERLKHNLNYALHEFKGHNFATFRHMIWAVFYHHFNIHDICSACCHSLQYKDNPEKLKKLHYQCKVEHNELYEQLLAIWQVYCTNKMLKDIHHSWNTNKCESMNQFIAKFIHKSQHLCCTIMGRARTYLAVLINSIGYKQYYRTLFELLDLDYNKNILLNYHQQLDSNKIEKDL